MKNAIVTGGTRGIGLAIAEMLLKEGYFVTITHSGNRSSFEECMIQLSQFSNKYEIVKADQRDKESMRGFCLQMRNKGHIDCIVLNAGMTLRKNLQDISEEDWEDVMQTNVNSNVFLLRDLFECIPNNSRIIVVGSMMGLLPHSMSLAYGVTKAAVMALSQNLVKVFEGTGTTVNAIAPGFVDTDWQKNKPEDIRQNICAKTAVRRFATPEEVADAVRFCIKNAFVNGSVIPVHGGYDYK